MPGSVKPWAFCLSMALFGTAAVFGAGSKVDADLAQYDSSVQKLNEEFSAVPADANNKVWVIKKLQHMVDVDQVTRKFLPVTHDHQYTSEEQTEFQAKFGDRLQRVDRQNTEDLKGLIAVHGWFRISEFGAAADQNAWLLVQHADHDPAFQRRVLVMLEPLSRLGETKPANYAYLFDRVASSFNDPSKRTLQRYGTQGTCVGPGKWEPLPIEDAANVDARRADVGLDPMANYITHFKDICR